jgi:hypothetical protein
MANALPREGRATHERATGLHQRRAPPRSPARKPRLVGEVPESGRGALEVREGVAAGGLGVGVPDDVGDQNGTVGRIAHEASGDGVAQCVRGLRDARPGHHRGDDLAD